MEARSRPGPRLLALLVDAVLLAALLLMVEFLARSLYASRGDGTLATAQETLERLRYAWLAGAGALLAVLWQAGERTLGASPGMAFAGLLTPAERDEAWDATLRGWFTAVFVELTFFTGWLVTEVELGTFFTNFGKAAEVIRGLLHPRSSVLFEGLILLVQTLFLAFMATAFAIPVFRCDWPVESPSLTPNRDDAGIPRDVAPVR